MNTEWHRRHPIPRGTSPEQRLAWNRAHQKACACRRIPPKLLALMNREPAIDEYLATVSPKYRGLLEELRETIHGLVPDVEECISYRLPAFRHEGRIIAGFSATSKGCSYYPFSGTTLTILAGQVRRYSQTKSALHFGPEERLPKSLLRKLIKARISEHEGSRDGGSGFR